MHVSPFLGMGLDYEFTLTPPGERFVAHIATDEAGEQSFDATLALERRPWTSANLVGQLVREPFLTAKVMAAIHWQAARLWWKGVPVHSHPKENTRPEVVRR
jgi:DUF1365 family protein